MREVIPHPPDQVQLIEDRQSNQRQRALCHTSQITITVANRAATSTANANLNHCHLQIAPPPEAQEPSARSSRHMAQLLFIFLICSISAHARAQSCGTLGVAMQVLGSGGPELQDKRAMSSYLVWQNGRARVLIDAGGGSALRFGESGATMSGLDVILFSHFHIDHSGDFAALIKSSWFEDRTRPLPIYGPVGNGFMPSTVEFVADLFAEKHGAYRYLSELFSADQQGSYKMQPHTVVGTAEPQIAFRSADLAASSVRVIHGVFPSLAWRVELNGKRIVFSGDTNGNDPALAKLAADADLFVAHNAVPEGVTGVERNLHMPPSVIGQIAGEAHVKNLVLSHRMLRTLGKEEQTESEIRRSYFGPLHFANDLDCFPLN